MVHDLDLDLASVDPAALSDEEAVALATLIEAREQLGRWSAIAESFPWPDRSSWPYPHRPALEWRKTVAATLDADPRLVLGADEYYRDAPKRFINHWCITYDPRNATRARPAKLPFLLFPKQEEMVDYVLALLEDEENGLIEKSRDMGATWLGCALSVWLWKYRPGAAIGWGSRKETLVDRLGDPDSIFEKMRMIIGALPAAFLPAGFSPGDHMTNMKIVNPENGATITGEAGDNIGRGGRKALYWKDESAHYERPEKIEAALGDNTNVQIDFSSVNGLGNVFHRRREAGYPWTGQGELLPNRTAVFIMDWRDHPAKNQAWYDGRRQKAEDEGILHLFRQEVDRDYAALAEGVIIPSEWVKSAIDAHLLLGADPGGSWRGALDVADGGGDTNASAWFEGIVLREVGNWGARDTGITTHRFLSQAEGKGEVEAGYDCVGVGSGVKAEANRLEDEGMFPPRVRLVPWNAGAGPLDPDEPVISGDRDSPLNRVFYGNMKAQAWWRTRLKFEHTHRAVQARLGKGPDFTWKAEELISIDSRMPLLRQIEKELSQPTAHKNPTNGKLYVDKTPEGTRSPNLADAIIMADNPASGLKPVITVARNQFEIPPFKLPAHFKRAFAMKVIGQRAVALWAAHDSDADILYFTTEYARDYAEPGVHAQAITARGRWIPGTFDCDATNARHFDELMRLYHGHGIASISAADRAVEAGVAELQQRISTGRLKVFSTCRDFFADYRGYRRDGEGRILGGGLMDCARHLTRPESIRRMIAEPSQYPGGGAAAPNLYR